MAVAKRLYLVRFAPDGEGSVIERLVNAKSPAGALRTAVTHLGGIARYAEQGDVYRLARIGMEPIEEGDTPQGELPLQSDPVPPEAA